MKKPNLLLGAILTSALAVSPVFAGSKDDDNNKDSYKEHFKQRHQMNMDMLQMLSETMTILRDINHKPSAEEQARLSDMIKQLDEMMKSHKEMEQKMGNNYQHHHKNRKENNEDDSQRGWHHDMN